MAEKEDYLGHRQRLKEKFYESGLTRFQDYEIIELLLTTFIPQRDVKPQAKEAIRRFENLRGFLEAGPEELQSIRGIGPHCAFCIQIMQAVAREFLKQKTADREFFTSSQEIYEYFYHSMRDLKKEMIKVVYLNTQNQILEIKDLSQGTVDSSFVYPREVMEGALKCSAVSLVVVHNHPSGNPAPSDADKDLTRKLAHSGSLLQIKLLDHLIIGDNKFYSFAGDGFIEKYEAELLSLKMR